MALTIKQSGQVVSVTFDGSTGFDLAALVAPGGSGVRLKKLVFYPNAANDVFTVRNGGAGEAPIAKVKDTTGGGRDLDFYGLRCFPYVKADEAPSGGLISFIFE